VAAVAAVASWSQAFAPSRPRLLFAAYLVALLPRLVILAASRGQSIEVWEYDRLARSIASGHGYVIPHFGHLSFAFGDGNLYSFLAGVVYVLVGNQPWILALLQAVAASLAAPVILAIGYRPLGPVVASIGASLAALHPGALAYTLKLHPLGLDVLLLSLLVLWLGSIGSRSRDGLLTGVALGLNLMSRPTFFLAGVVALVLPWQSLRRHVLPVSLAVIVGVSIALPWVGRNWMVFGRPVFITTGLEDVWKGNNPAASGSSYLASGQDVFTAMPSSMRLRLNAASELQMNDVFGDEVVSFIRDKPGEFLTLVARKFYYFWWFSPQSGLFYPSSWLAAYQVYDGVILALAALGAISILRFGSPEARRLLGLLATITLTIALVHALTYVEGRHRWGIEPLLLLLTAEGLVGLLTYFRVRARAIST
jgi:Dolichyl-phosphate-mannose-protein mannosyltransferase